MKTLLKRAVPMAEAFSRLLFPFAEVVLHDLEKGEIEAIYNPFSKRKIGDSSYLDHWNFIENPIEEVVGPYEKINYDGRKLKSISIVIQNEKREAKGLLCINIDISVFMNCQNILEKFLENTHSLSQETQRLFKDDLYEKINLFVQEYCRLKQICLDNLSREDKQLLILRLKEKGAFSGKNATSYIARILNISRATVYNYLQTKETVG